MGRKKEHVRLKQLLSEAIMVLCKASISFQTDFNIQGLVGITVDSEDIFLVNLNDHFSKARQEEALQEPERSSSEASAEPTPTLQVTEQVQASRVSSPPHSIKTLCRRSPSPVLNIKQEKYDRTSTPPLDGVCHSQEQPLKRKAPQNSSGGCLPELHSKKTKQPVEDVMKLVTTSSGDINTEGGQIKNDIVVIKTEQQDSWEPGDSQQAPSPGTLASAGESLSSHSPPPSTLGSPGAWPAGLLRPDWMSSQPETLMNLYKMGSLWMGSAGSLNESSNSEFVCPICARTFYNRYEMQLHQKSHKGAFACQFCEKSFSNNQYLKQHERGVHLLGKRFQCTTCGKKYSKKQNLQIHMYRHASEMQGK